MKKTFLPILALLLASTACKKSSTTPTPPVVLEKYMSSTAGSTWLYRQVNNLTMVTTNYTLTSTNRDSTANSKVYHVFTNSNTGINEYYNVTGNDYFAFRTLAAVSNVKLDDLYLKDNSPVGTSWAQTINLTIPGIPLPVPITITYSIVEKGIARTVNGIAYTDVIRVSGSITSTLIPAANLVTDIQNYFARKYGFIETNNKFNLNYLGIVQNTDNKTILLSADIK